MIKKRTLWICLAIIGLCLAVATVSLFTNRSEKREPTSQELEAYRVYEIDWQEITGLEGTVPDMILSLCTYETEQIIGENLYDIYVSEQLAQYLPDFEEMMQIARIKDGPLYIQYTTSAGNMITLGYDHQGLCEKSIYDASQDTMYYETRETKEVWTKFSTGVQWGN